MLKKLSFNSPIYVVKRMNVSKRNAWFIRIGTMLFTFLLAGVISTILSPGSFGLFYKSMFESIYGDFSYIFDLLCCISIYLLLSLAVTPAFKMKFWNIGAEGQAVMGATVTAVILLKAPESLPGIVVILLALVAGISAGIIWALIPTLCKVKFKTNETLFTLMMNYIATALATMVIAIFGGTTRKFPKITDESRLITSIGEINYLPVIIVAVLLTVFMVFYLKKSKQGFELSVLGDSTNTARYAGMKINKITIRTMIISGAIAGLVGFLLVCGVNGNLTSDIVKGRGFTAVLISWLGHFNPGEIAIYSCLIGFFDYGTKYAATPIGVNDEYFSALIIGLSILVIIVAEFFVRYQIKLRKKDQVASAAPAKETKNNSKLQIKTKIAPSKTDDKGAK